MRRALPLIALVGLAGAAATLVLPSVPTFASTRFAPRFSPDFLAHWSDGKAELAGYELTQPRYGAPREGQAVAIFVKEPFSESDRLKADPGRPERDVFEVMKLNLVEDFQTGVYDYNVMTSAFVGLEESGGRPPGAPAKVSFSSQEWCGQVYHHLLFDESRVRQAQHSYFDGEGDRLGTLESPEQGLAEDAAWHWARGMTGPVIAPGEAKTVAWLPSLKRTRLLHQPLAWGEARLSRSKGPEEVTVPAGTFAVERRTIEVKGGPTLTFLVEQAFPHRVVKVEGGDGYEAALTGSTRLPYWKLNQPGQERFLAELGLPVPKAR